MTATDDTRICDSSRREFLRRAATCSGAAILVVAVGPLSSMDVLEPQDQDKEGPSPANAGSRPYDPHDHEYVFLMDINKCIGCGACVRACELENEVPEGYFRTWVERYEVSRTGHVEVDSPNGGHNGFAPRITDREITKAFFVPKLCNHCTETPCVQLCPVGASYRSPDGLILVDEERCIGCGYCIQACPYGSRFMHPVTHTASKCTFCYHRITKGLPTACEQACPSGARKLGDLKQEGDEVAQILATGQVQVMKPELHTKPNCYYLGMGAEVK